jgi:hypothetical protein
MYRFIRSLSVREIFLEHVPSVTVSFVIAETFYKFHSFTLECLAFLATWYLLDILANSVFKRSC